MKRWIQVAVVGVLFFMQTAYAEVLEVAGTAGVEYPPDGAIAMHVEVPTPECPSGNVILYAELVTSFPLPAGIEVSLTEVLPEEERAQSEVPRRKVSVLTSGEESLRFDVTSVVNDWLAGRRRNAGFELQVRQEQDIREFVFPENAMISLNYHMVSL